MIQWAARNASNLLCFVIYHPVWFAVSMISLGRIFFQIYWKLFAQRCVLSIYPVLKAKFDHDYIPPRRIWPSRTALGIIMIW